MERRIPSSWQTLTASAVLDAMVDPIALLDSRAMILWVNRCWQRRALERGIPTHYAWQGRSYFDYRPKDRVRGYRRDEAAIADGIQAVLRGDRPSFEADYLSSAPDDPDQWARIAINQVPTDSGALGLVHHREVTAAAHELHQLQSHCQRLERRNRTLSHLADTDPLTDLENRRALTRAVSRESRHAQRTGHPCAALLIDCDNFKSINERHGYRAGDAALCAIADCLERNLRPHDHLGRVGGDEFLILLPETSLETAKGISSRLTRAAAALSRPDRPAPTISIGVARIAGADDNAERVIARTQAALKRAKLRGKNRVAVESDPATESSH